MATCSFARALPLCGLPTELWDLVFSNSSLADLCTCRAVHPFLRTLIDEKNMKRLKNAFQCSGLPSLDSALQRFAGSEEDTDRANLPAILKPDNHGTDSWAYIQLLGYGYCRVCGAQTGELPLSSDLKVCVCGKSACMAALHSARFSHDEWSGGETGQYEYFIASEASESLPYIRKLDDKTPPTRGTRITYCNSEYLDRPGSKYILADVLRASEELSDIGLRFMSQDEAWSLSNYLIDPGVFDPPDHDSTLRLLETWKRRVAHHHATETIFMAITEWRQATAARHQSIHEKNLDTLRTVVADKPGVNQEAILNDPLTQRILAAHARDEAYAYSFTFRDLLPSSKVKQPGQQKTGLMQPSKPGVVRSPKQGKGEPSSRNRVNALRHRCDLCGQSKGFASRTKLHKHMKDIHPHATR
ncbi:hypothetical protein K523DRAFT_358514 [Schizophyllum commune Tattone D]|nr:hypothetical protein K523DRAFT_358514 [Schizophyllum commune Tattone D]